MKSRKTILSERKKIGFCQCHECIERAYESEVFWSKMQRKIKKSIKDKINKITKKKK